jgi:uncharacterized protein YbaR (Trm112 family)/SAM-dependent methyltransferase
LRTVEQQVDRLQAILPMLACPVCGGALVKTEGELISSRCGARYPVVDGVPILLPPEMVAQGLGCQLGLDDNISMHPYSEASNQIIGMSEEGWVLDLGAGGKHIGNSNVVQLDVFRFPMTDVVGSADCLPFQSGAFRAVVSQAVFEHLQYPEAAASEVWRVLCPDGVAKIDTAFLQPEHAYPHHYFNATEAGLRHWFRDFEIEWSGVEPYQHPKWSLVWFLSVYFASLPDKQRLVLEPVGLGACLDVLSRLSRGVSTAADTPIVNALDGLVPDGVRTLAAGVAVRAVKRVANGVVPRKVRTDVGNGNVLLALERRLEKLTRDRRIDSDHAKSQEQMRVIVADRTRYLLHARELADQSGSRSLSDVSMGALVRQVVKRLLPFAASKTSKRVQEASNLKDQSMVRLVQSLPSVGMTFVVCPRHPVELLDLYFSLAHQTHSDWELIVGLDSECSDFLRQLAVDLPRLDGRVRVSHDTAVLQRDQLAGARWVLLTPDTVLDFDAVLELVSLGARVGAVPIVCDVDSWIEAAQTPVRCHGFVPEGVASSAWYDLAWRELALSSVQPWVAYSLRDGSIGDVQVAPTCRPAYVPQSLFRLQSFAIA